MKGKAVLWFAVFGLLIPTVAPAKVTEFVIESREVLFDGASFGHVGQYEMLRGYAVGELDPSLAGNAGIVNLNKAPLNAHGRVEYRVDVQIQKPVNLKKGNGTLLYDVVNRGRPLVTSRVRLEDGFTLVWSGWQGGLTPNGVLLTAQFPIARNSDGTSIVGLSREEFVDIGLGTSMENLSYPAADMDPSLATLTVREKERDPRQPLDNTYWQYLNDSQIEITHPGAPYDAGAIFEFIYPAKDPIVMGIGFAATRDVNSFLRFEEEDSVGNPNPLMEDEESSQWGHHHRGHGYYGHHKKHGARVIKRAIIEGISQSGRFTRDFLWQGFNQDEQGRQIFDGAIPVIAGSRKTWTNYEFAQPGRWSKQHEDHLQRGDQFPFTYQTIKDPLTGEVDGILKKCTATHTCPKIMHLDGEFEVWGARGSLVVTDGNPSGPRDLHLPSNVRVYMVSGTPHGGAGTIIPTSPTYDICKNLLNPNGSLVVLNALIPAMNDWITYGKRPPNSRYGSVHHRHLLVRSDQASTGFPNIPGVTYNGLFNSIRVTDYSVVPPTEGEEYGVLVPRDDSDGNSLAGIRLPALEVPIATYTGWNLRAAGHAEDEGCSSRASYIPFAQTAAERLAAGDPRPSIEERYRSHSQYLWRFKKAAYKLVKEGYLLPEQAEDFVNQANGDAIKALFPN
jgi:hypothetical protein